MTETGHLSRNTLVRAFDGELSAAERLELEVHLSQCEQCLEEFDRVADLSDDIARLVDRTFVSKPRQAREQLAEKMIAVGAPLQRNRSSKKLVAWASAAAALLALSIGFGLHSVAGHSHPQLVGVNATAGNSRTEATVESTDLSFVQLPYSNPALPLESQQIVRVNMRLSELASTGVVRMTPPGSDAWVEADVLLGMDGEPYGIHVIGNVPRNQETNF